MAPSFSTEITTAILWLSEQWGLDIRCVKAQLYQLAGRDYLDTTQELPLKSAAAYKVRLRDKADQEERQRARSWRPKSLDEIKSRAIANGIGEPFLALCVAADRWGLHSGFWPWGVAYFRLVNYTSAGANESVLAASPTPHVKGKVYVWVSPARFQAESDGAIGAQTVIDALGTRETGGMLGKIDDIGWATLNVSPDEMNQFIERLDPVVSNPEPRLITEDSAPPLVEPREERADPPR